MPYEDSIKYQEQRVTRFHAHGKYGGLEVEATGEIQNDTFTLVIDGHDIRPTWDEIRYLIAFLQRVVAP